jgi:hypothetical protein
LALRTKIYNTNEWPYHSLFERSWACRSSQKTSWNGPVHNNNNNNNNNFLNKIINIHVIQESWFFLNYQNFELNVRLKLKKMELWIWLICNGALAFWLVRLQAVPSYRGVKIKGKRYNQETVWITYFIYLFI